MKATTCSRNRLQAGYAALFITLTLVGISALILGATLTRSVSNTRLNDRRTLYISANGAAEAAVEKVLARMMVDFSTGQEATVYSNLSYYQTSLLPTTGENPFWTNFVWSDGLGHNGQIYVARTSTSSMNNEPFVQLERQYTNLSGYSASYRILANVSMPNTTFNYNFTNAVQQDVQLATIPVFQFAIFYNALLEFSDCAPLTVNGPVHCNTNIFVGCLSSSSLTFNAMVTASGTVTNPANMGYPQSDWTGPIKYNGSPYPGYLTGTPALTLPIGTNSTVGSNVQAILYPPPTGETANSPMGLQRYYNKARMVIWIGATNNYTIILKGSSTDPNPYAFTGSLNTLTNTNSYFPFLSTTNVLFDHRENKNMLLTQIDVAKLTNFMQTNIYLYNTNGATNKFAKGSSSTAMNLIYVADWRTTNSGNCTAVRLINGATLPSDGLTVATPNPLYIQGVYNCGNPAYYNTTNVTASPPASVACDALTVLSPKWKDSASFSANSNNIPSATSDTVNAAIIAGNIPSTGSGTYQNSGGVHNLPRLLENWSSQILTLNTSMVCLFSSTWGTGQFIPPSVAGSYYSPPNRDFNFNVNYMSSGGMPPGTPDICALIRSSWSNPAPNTTTGPSVTLGFVPH